MNGTKDVDSGNWQAEALNSIEPIVVDFWHEQCRWCKRLDPELREIAKQFSRKAMFVRFNILSNPRNTLLAHKYGVTSTPMLVMFCR